MNNSKALIYTRLLVALSIILSLLSLVTSNQNLGNPYPFFSWKLYSQPLGTHGNFSEYRIYSKMKTETIYHRNSIIELSTFTTDEYLYTLNYFVAKTLAHPSKYKVRLLEACKHLVPDAKEYKIVLETYKPSDLYSLANKNKYDTITIVGF